MSSLRWRTVPEPPISFRPNYRRFNDSSTNKLNVNNSSHSVVRCNEIAEEEQEIVSAEVRIIFEVEVYRPSQTDRPLYNLSTCHALLLLNRTFSSDLHFIKYSIILSNAPGSFDCFHIHLSRLSLSLSLALLFSPIVLTFVPRCVSTPVLMSIPILALNKTPLRNVKIRMPWTRSIAACPASHFFSTVWLMRFPRGQSLDLQGRIEPENFPS